MALYEYNRPLYRKVIKHKVFISYHHDNDQYYKDVLVAMNERYSLFVDHSVDTGDVSDALSDERIREIIRDQYLRDSTVTIVLVGTETKKRKHVDWEIYSSMYDGTVNKRSGILVINLPGINGFYIWTSHAGEKKQLYPDISNWTSFSSRLQFESHFPDMPERIIDNLAAKDVRISVVNWNRIENDPSALEFLINATYNDREGCKYNLSMRMKRDNR